VNPLYKQIIRSSVSGTLVLCLLLFVPAGTLAYWQGWAFIAVFAGCCAAYTVYLVKHDPALLRRRMEAGVAHEKERTQKVVMASMFALCIAIVVVSPLDVRFGWSKLPWIFSVLGDALVIFSFYLFYLVSRVNTFAAASVRVEAGQQVISTGLYGRVRHPMYSAALFLLVGTPLALGSLWTLAFIPLALAILIARILNEEQVLLRELPGYAAYRAKVTTRLVPFVW
jgi:protein-S-isoprenylcysteine O-methyltransferase Ste14